MRHSRRICCGAGQVTANTVVIGDTNSGAVTVSVAISPANYQALDIQKDVTFSGTGGFASDVTSAMVFEKHRTSAAPTSWSASPSHQASAV